LIYNLCDNAIKYNKQGGRVDVSLKKDKKYITFDVKDTGIGIDSEHHERIFERFYRVDKSHSKEVGGTGLGLSIVKHDVNFLGGNISINSKLSEGTHICVRIPV
jgi:two-component system phosphate regulon sensor histidine kinase PhoR